MNNFNLSEIEKFVAKIQKNPKQAKVYKRIAGVWNLREGKPQFTAQVEYAKGKTTLKADPPVLLGGWGNNPDPIQYFLYGLSACFAATFVTSATREGVRLTKLEVTSETVMNMRRYFGISKEPITKKIKLTVVADGPSRNVIKKLLKVTYDRCPGVEWVTRKIPLEIELKNQ